jgi:hypothetical protein
MTQLRTWPHKRKAVDDACLLHPVWGWFLTDRKGGVMPDDFEIRKTEDGRVLVILHPACTISKEAILALLVARFNQFERI